MYILQCWIEHPVRTLDQTFTYLSNEQTFRGCRVRAVFGMSSLTAFVDSCEYTGETKEQIESRMKMKLRFIDEIIDTQPLITDELYDMAMWMKEATLSPAISCFGAMLPAKVKPASGDRKIVMEKYAVLTEEECELTPKQLEAYIYVRDNQSLLYSDLRKLFPNQARQLVTKNAIAIIEKEKKGSLNFTPGTLEKPELTDLQKSVINEIETSDDTVYLLRGVTGSGKTEIYLQLAEKALSKGKQVLILVPEIALTPQMIERVSSRFGSKLAIYHSSLNPQEKYEQYRLVMNNEAQVVVGTRSAVFLPFENLGLIVMDEEHDTSYKQDSMPCYHCRDAAVFRAQYNHCKLVLASATPSLESYARGLKKVYHLIVMEERINKTLPSVTIVPMKQSIRKAESYIISDVLREKITDRLDKNEQVILLLNRRGYHARLRCRHCGEVIRCPHCDLAMSWHRDTRMMKCHTCGTEMRLPLICPSCGSKEGFMPYGFGTEKLEHELETLFPSARVLRMDADTTSRKNGHERILKAFAEHKADILLGTQMIAKGLDYALVTLVGIINGDDGLARTDFRSCETTFDLLMQASGRSGRSEREGEVVMQVFDPDHYTVQSAAKQDYTSFFQEEMRFRHAGRYPPYTYLISVTFSSLKEEEPQKKAEAFKNGLHGDYKLIGVISLLKTHDLYRSRILLKGKNLDLMRRDLSEFMAQHPELLKGIRIDINPMYLD